MCRITGAGAGAGEGRIMQEGEEREEGGKGR